MRLWGSRYVEAGRGRYLYDEQVSGTAWLIDSEVRGWKVVVEWEDEEAPDGMVVEAAGVQLEADRLMKEAEV